MTDFDLRHLVHQTVATRDTWTLYDLIDAIDIDTPTLALRTAYRQALTEYARVHMGSSSSSCIDHDSSDDHTTPVDAGPTSQPGHERSDDQSATAGLGPNIKRSRSALIRAGFRQRIHTGPSTWKAIELCTSAELLYAAAECDRMAEWNQARANQYRELACAMADHGVVLVKELAAEVIERVFQR